MKKTITKDELIALYQNNNNQTVCDKLGISMPTLIRYLKALKIKTKGKGGGVKFRPARAKKINIVGV